MQSPNHTISNLWPQGWTNTQTYLHESDFKKSCGQHAPGLKSYTVAVQLFVMSLLNVRFLSYKFKFSVVQGIYCIYVFACVHMCFCVCRYAYVVCVYVCVRRMCVCACVYVHVWCVWCVSVHVRMYCVS